MCRCTPSIRTPYCKKPGCGWEKIDYFPSIFDKPEEQVLGYISLSPQGWECPKCHSVYSPSHPHCDNCYRPDLRATS